MSILIVDLLIRTKIFKACSCPVAKSLLPLSVFNMEKYVHSWLQFTSSYEGNLVTPLPKIQISIFISKITKQIQFQRRINTIFQIPVRPIPKCSPNHYSVSISIVSISVDNESTEIDKASAHFLKFSEKSTMFWNVSVTMIPLKNGMNLRGNTTYMKVILNGYN